MELDAPTERDPSIDGPPPPAISGQEPLTTTQCTNLLIEKLEESGVMHLMRRYISNRLTRFGWHASLRHSVVDYIKRNGPNNVNISHMWSDLAQVGLDLTPLQVKEEVKKYLDQFGQTYVELDDEVRVTTEQDDHMPYEMQSRDVIPEPPSGLYPPSPGGTEHSKYVKPPWLFVYDKPKSANDPSATGPPTNGSDSGDSDNYDSSSPSSPYSNTPPENVNDEEADHDDEDSLDSRGEAAKNPEAPYHREKAGRERKKRLEKARQRDRQQAERARASSADPSLSRGTARVKTSGPKMNSGLVSPQLSIPLRQLKLERREQGEPHHKTKSSRAGAGAGASGPASNCSLLEEDDEEEEELMDV